MSMISDLIERLKTAKKGCADYRDAKVIDEAAEVIQELSDKLHAASMERSSQYYNGGWIPAAERLPEDGAHVIVTVRHARWISDYGSDVIPKELWNNHPEYYEVCGAIRDGDELVKIDDDCHESVCYVPAGKQEDDIAYPVEEIIAWMPMPEPYQKKDPGR